MFRLVFISFVILLSAACSEEDQDTIKFGLSTAPVTLDPRYATDAVSHRINRLLYRRLVDFNEHYQMIPQLANWEQISPELYRFRLGSEGRQFHNGDYLMADDVKATYESVLDQKNISPHRATLINIKDIVVIDQDTVDFHLNDVDPLFPGRLVIGIIPAKLIRDGHSFQKLPVGSGGMEFLEWPVEDHLYLKRRDDQAIFEFITVKDSTVRALKLVRGEIDLVQGDLPFELMDWLGDKKDIVIEKKQGSTYTYIGFNMHDAALSNLNIRMAIAHAIDSDAIIKNVLGNAARKAGTMLPFEHWATNQALEGYEYDPDRSKELLRRAGYGDGNRLKLSYKTSSNPLRVRLATIIQYQLQQVGIDVDVQSYDWGTFYGDIKDGRFQMYSLSWVGLNMPDIFRYVFHSSSIPPAGANRGRYSDPVVDGLIEKAENTIDPEEQAVIYRDLQYLIHQQLPYVPLWYEDNILARRSSIRGYRLSPDGDYDGLLNAKRVLDDE